MNVIRVFALKTAVILTFVASLVIALQNPVYLWFLLLLIPAFIADIIRIIAIAHIGKVIAIKENTTNEQPDKR